MIRITVVLARLVLWKGDRGGNLREAFCPVLKVRVRRTKNVSYYRDRNLRRDPTDSCLLWRVMSQNHFWHFPIRLSCRLQSASLIGLFPVKHLLYSRQRTPNP